jgi:putative exporter of polyketide antibiotics
MTSNEPDTKSKPDYNTLIGTSRREKLKERLKLCLIIGSIYLGLSIFSVGCPLRFLSGIPCPGCGMTRAVWYALQLDFASAVYYHPLFFLAPLMVLLFLFESYLPPKFIRIAWGFIITLFLLIYLLRLLLFQNEVVRIDIRSGAVLRLFYNIFVGGN